MSIRIVLIDDDPEDIEIMLEVLNTMSPEFNIRAFSDPCRAIEIMRAVETPLVPHYVLLDMFMHKMDGLTCLQQLRQIQALKDTTFLVHSTSALDRHVLKKLKEAGSTVFQKPASFKGFESMFRIILKQTC